MGVKVREKDGAWWVFINHQHRRKAKRIGIGKEGKSAANRAAAKIQAKLALGDVGILDDQTPQAIPTFEAVALEWERLTTPNWLRNSHQGAFPNVGMPSNRMQPSRRNWRGVDCMPRLCSRSTLPCPQIPWCQSPENWRAP